MATAFSNGYDDAYLLKMDSGGNVLWSKAYGGTYQDRSYNVAVCTDGGFVFTGYTSLFATSINWNLHLVRTDSDGNISWAREIGGSQNDFGWYVDQVNDDGFIVVGSTKSYGAGNYDGYIVKTDAAGALQWTRAIGGSSSDQFLGFSKTSDEGYIVTGTTSSNSFGSSDIWLVKLNSAGDTLWTRQYGKATEDAGNAVIQTNDGGYLIAGDVHITPAAGDHNTFLLKTDPSGDLQWVKTYGSSPGTEIAWDLRQTNDNGFLFFGASAAYGNGGGGDIFSVKTDPNGTVQWAKTYGGTAFDDFWYSQPTPDEGSMMVGLTYEGGGQNILVVKTDSLGNSSCNTTTVVPIVNTPVLQVRSGTNVTSAGTMNTPNTQAYPAASTSKDPCALVDVPEKEHSLEISVFPNPFREKTNILMPEMTSKTASLRLFNVFGQEVFPILTLNSNGFTIHKGDISEGIYLYRIEAHYGNIGSGKIVIQ